MSQLLKTFVAKKSGGALYGVNRAEYLREKRGVTRLLLEIGEAAFHPI